MQEMQNTKKKVLISFVGARDPYVENREKKEDQAHTFWKRLFRINPSSPETVVLFEGSVLTVCMVLMPDLVYLFPSSKDMAVKIDKADNQTEDRANQVREIMTQWENGPECHVLPLMTDNVADASKLYPCFRDNINKVMNGLVNRAGNRENWQEEYEITFVTSSGTQQMNQIAQLSLAKTPFKVQYCHCSSPEFVKNGESRVFPIDLLPLEETTLLKRIDANVEGL